MVMQMLAAGGVPAFSDGMRIADEDNPQGYLEHSGVKRLAHDATCVAQAVGHVVKVVVPLVAYLPSGFAYRVILVERNLDQVLASQQKMIDRAEIPGGKLSAKRMKEVLAKQLTRSRRELKHRSDIEWTSLEYADAIEQPEATAIAIADFLKEPLDIEAMTAVVDQRLYRNRGG